MDHRAVAVPSLKDLKPDPRNARKRTDRSASLIQESLQRFGAARSIVIDEDGRILAGNGTVEGAKAAGNGSTCSLSTMPIASAELSSRPKPHALHLTHRSTSTHSRTR